MPAEFVTVKSLYKVKKSLDKINGCSKRNGMRFVLFSIFIYSFAKKCLVFHFEFVFIPLYAYTHAE